MSIEKTYWGAVAYIAQYRKALLQALMIPTSVLILFSMMDIYGADTGSTGILILRGLLEMYLFTLIAITTHRVILMGPGAVHVWGIYFPSRRELKYIVYMIMVVLCALPAIVLVVVPEIGKFLVTLMMLYILSRLSLVFPSIATGQPMTIPESWRATDQHKLMMFVAVAAIPAVFMLLDKITTDSPVLGQLMVILSILISVFEVALLSVAYSIIRSEIDDEPDGLKENAPSD